MHQRFARTVLGISFHYLNYQGVQMSWFSPTSCWMVALEGGAWVQAVSGMQHLPCPCNHQGHTGSGRLGLGLASGLWQRRARASQALLGQPSKTGSFQQPEKLGHFHLLCLLNDLYLSSLLKLKFKICIQRC